MSAISRTFVVLHPATSYAPLLSVLASPLLNLSSLQIFQMTAAPSHMVAQPGALPLKLLSQARRSNRRLPLHQLEHLVDVDLN